MPTVPFKSSVSVSVIACVLDFNNGVEYYQTVNSLIKRTELGLFDISVFQKLLVSSMPLHVEEGRSGNV